MRKWIAGSAVGILGVGISVTAFAKQPTATPCGLDAAMLKSLDYSLQLALGARNAATAAVNANRGGINLYGMRLFARPAIKTSDIETTEGTRSFLVARDGND